MLNNKVFILIRTERMIGKFCSKKTNEIIIHWFLYYVAVINMVPRIVRH